MAYKQKPIESLSESAWQAWIVDLGKWLGWRVFHPRPAQIAGRWATHYTGDAGYPDLTMVHDRRGFIMVECKSARGRLTAGQLQWHAALKNAGIEVYVWRPADYREVEERLKRVAQ